MFLTTILVSFFLTAQPAKVEGEELVITSSSPTEGETPVKTFEYTYNPFGKRDPFESFINTAKEERVISDNPLLNWDLNKFDLVGIVWGMANPRAIVRDGDGKGHIIRNGTRIGRNRGKVMRILKDRVVVAEEYRDPLGKLSVSEYSMMLNPEDEGSSSKK